MNRRLTLKAETLSELATSELRSVVGAAITNNQGLCYSLNATTCRTGVIKSIDVPCP